MKSFKFTLVITLLIGMTSVAVAADNDVYPVGGLDYRPNFAGPTPAAHEPHKLFFNSKRVEKVDGVADWYGSEFRQAGRLQESRVSNERRAG